MTRKLIINADDFGLTDGINRGIADCHRAGIVTSTSLMVLAHAAEDAVALARELPGLSIGLHWVDDEVDSRDQVAVAGELQRQLARFEELLGREPDHLDSHHHVHLREDLLPRFAQAGKALGIPVRGDGSVRFVGGFYGQWEPGVTDLDHVSVPALQRILREEVGPGWNELGCHPGYVTTELLSSYRAERELELRTLTDPVIADTITELGIDLCSY